MANVPFREPHANNSRNISHIWRYLEVLAAIFWLASALFLTLDDTASRTTLGFLFFVGLILGSIWTFRLLHGKQSGTIPTINYIRHICIYPMSCIAIFIILAYNDTDILKFVPIVNRTDLSGMLGNTAARPKSRRLMDHLNYVKQSHIAGHIDVLWIGDSLTDHWRSEGRWIWAREFGHLRTLNFGVAGDRIQNVLWRITHGEIDQIRPKVIVLEVGTNNLNRNNDSEIVSALTIVTKQIHSLLPDSKLILMGILPRGSHIDDPINLRIASINTQLLAFSISNHADFLDFGDKLTDTQGNLERALPGGVHLSEEGYSIWAHEIAPLFKTLLNAN